MRGLKLIGLSVILSLFVILQYNYADTVNLNQAQTSAYPTDIQLLIDQAKNAEKEQNYNQASELLTQALTNLKATQAFESDNIQNLIIGLALIYLHQGGYAYTQADYTTAQQAYIKAETTIQQAIAHFPDAAKANDIQKRYLGFHYASLATIYMGQAVDFRNHAQPYILQQNVDKAEPLLKQSIEILRKILAIAQTQPQLKNQTDLASLLQITPNQLASRLIELAKIYQTQERYIEANSLLDQSHELLQATADTSEKMAGLFLLVQTYDANHTHAERIEPLLKQILTFCEKNNSDSILKSLHIQSLLQLGDYSTNDNQLAQVPTLYEQAMHLAEQYKQTDLVILGAMSLANFYTKQQNFTASEPLLLKALQLKQTAAQEQNNINDIAIQSMLSILYTALATNYLALKNYTEAKAYFNKNIANPLNQLSAIHLGSKAASLHGLAKVYSLENDFSSAQQALAQASNLYKSTPVTDSLLPKRLQDLARTRLWVLQRGLAHHQTTLTQALPDLFSALQEVHGNGRTQALSKATLQLTISDAITHTNLEQLWQLQQQLQQLETRYTASLSHTSEADLAKSQQLQAEIKQTTATIAELDNTLQNTSILYAQLIQPKPLTLEQTQQLLQPDEALLVWVIAQNQALIDEPSYLLVVKAVGEAQFFPLNLKRKTLTTVINDTHNGLLATLADPTKPFDLNLAYGLYQQLLAPAAQALQGVKHILAVTDGPLQNIPLHALIQTLPSAKQTYGEADWLAKHYDFSYLPAVHSLAHLRAYSTATNANQQRLPFIGFGDPVVKGQPTPWSQVFTTMGLNLRRGAQGNFLPNPEILRQSLVRLPETADEIRHIAQLLGADVKTSVYLGEQYTESRLKQLNQTQQLQQFSIVSFATHALLPASDSGDTLLDRQEAGLVMTPPSQGSAQDDGFLSASEAANLQLKADWVLLSACNTGKPDKQGNYDGLSQLAKAFFVAGSRSVLASLWSVNSHSTEQLMTSLFTQLKAQPHLRRATALQQSMLALIGQPSECNWLCHLGWSPNYEPAHPAYWAPFVVYGEGGAMQKP